MKKSLIFFSFLIIFNLFIFSYERIINGKIKYENLKIAEKNNYNFIEILSENFSYGNDVGKPMLPILNKTIILDSDEIISNVQFIEKSKKEIISNFKNYMPIQPQYPLSYNKKINFINMSDDFIIYPENKVISFSSSSYRGVNLGCINFIPFEYNKEKNKVFLISDYELKITITKSHKQNNIAKHINYQDYKLLENLTEDLDKINFEKENNYSYYNLLVITNNTFYSKALEFASYKDSLGISTKVAKTEDINTNFSGKDLAEKIRNFIKKEYNDFAIRNVLLIGDVAIIPTRGFYANSGGTIDNNIPGDIYYSALDGTWDENNNNLYGENINEIDFLPEIGIGRFSVNSNTELVNIINKTKNYQKNPVISDIKKIFLVGELLWQNATGNIYGDDYVEQLVGIHGENGYTTVGIPTDHTFYRVYEKNGEWFYNQLVTPMNSNGLNLINHMGHSNTIYNMKIYMDYLNDVFFSANGNNHLNFIEFSQGCYAASFDNRGTEYGQYYSDSFAEKLLKLKNGAVAYIGNSRYGWGDATGTNGASQKFHRFFIEAIYHKKLNSLGDALNYSKIKAAFGNTNGTFLWCLYEINLLGDPTLMVWTDTPSNLDITSITEVVNTPQLIIDLTPYNVNSVYANITNSSNEVITNGNFKYNILSFNSSNLAAGNYNINIYANNYYKKTIPLNMINPTGGFVTIDSVIISELNAENSNGFFENYEKLNLKLYLRNCGISQNAPVNINIKPGNNFSNLTGTITIPSLNPGETLVNNQLNIQINANNPELEYEFPIIIEVNNLDTKFCYQKLIKVTNPKIQFNNISIVSINNENRTYPIFPSDEIKFRISFKNIGKIPAQNYTLHLTSESGIFQNDIILPLEEINLNNIYSKELIGQLSSSVALDQIYKVIFLIASQDNYQFEDSIKINVGAFYDTFETDYYSWYSEELNNLLNPWNKNKKENHTINGKYSYSVVQEADSTYWAFSHAALNLPEINVTEQFNYLEYYQKYDFEDLNGNYANDGFFIEYSIDNNDWQLFTNSSISYNAVLNDLSLFCYPYNIPCWGGKDFQWKKNILDLNQFIGKKLKLRFVFFADYNYIGGKGLYLDDFKLTGMNSIEENLNKTKLSLSNSPNPFNPSTTITYEINTNEFVNLSIFNIKGELVKVLVNENKKSGKYSILWDGKDNSGKSVGSGIYFYKLKVGKKEISNKMVLLK